MEKISGIIGASPRLKSADLQNSPPIRPGAPSFGQPIGEVSIAHRKDLTTAQKANMIREQMIEDKKRFKEQETIENLSEKFFMNQMEQRSLDVPPSVEVEGMVQGASDAETVIGDLDPEEMKYMPKGYYLDRSA